MQALSTSYLGLLFSVVWAMPSFGQAPGNPDIWWHPAWGWGHMIFGGLMMILFWGGIIVLVLLAIRWLGGGAASSRLSSPMPHHTPLEILKDRFAKGEIDKEEYEERRKLLLE